MKAGFFSFVVRTRVLAAVLSVVCVGMIACGQKIEPIVLGPAELALPAGISPADFEKALFPAGTKGQPPVYPNAVHLAQCGTGYPDCAGGTTCVGLSGASACFFNCDPKKGEGEKQNPDCISPENCIRLNSGSGVCIFFPGQLYGSGSYKALVRYKRGERCLLRYGGCIEYHVCVDTKNNGSIGTCEESCTPATSKESKNQPVCMTPNTQCKVLASGIGACLP